MLEINNTVMEVKHAFDEIINGLDMDKEMRGKSMSLKKCNRNFQS